MTAIPEPCSSAGNCPGIQRQSDGDYAVTGYSPDDPGVEQTVIVPAEVMHAAAAQIVAEDGAQ